MGVQSGEVFSCDFGWRTMAYLKLVDTDGRAGWAEFPDAFGNAGIRAVVEAMLPAVLGSDPLRRSVTLARLRAGTAPSPSGINAQAIGAIENALTDLAARTLDVPVHLLVGGAVRDEIPVYWSHFGIYRQDARADAIGVPRIRTYADVSELARAARRDGYRYLKTNLMALDNETLRGRPAPWTRPPDVPGREWDRQSLDAAAATLQAVRDGAGDDAGIIFDANTGYGADGHRRMAALARSFDVEWLELDGQPPDVLRALRDEGTAIGSGESLFGTREYEPFLAGRALDVCIVDVLWNGFGEALRIASHAGTHGVGVAPHNFYGHLSTCISLQYAACLPNLSILELDVDGVPARDEIVPDAPRPTRGVLALPAGPGWGVEVNEDAIRFYAGRRADRTAV